MGDVGQNVDGFPVHHTLAGSLSFPTEFVSVPRILRHLFLPIPVETR
jgi:hypothetical protein